MPHHLRAELDGEDVVGAVGGGGGAEEVFAVGAGDVLVDEAVVGVRRGFGLCLWLWCWGGGEEWRLGDVVALCCGGGVEDWVADS